MPEIHFRGIMLFRTENGVIREAVFPDTRRRPPGKHHNSSGPKKHHDDTEAIDHHPGVVHWRSQSDQRSYRINSAVTFGGGSEEVSSDVLADFPEMSSLKDERLEYDPEAPVAATIGLTFPSTPTASVVLPVQRFYLNSAQAIPLVLKLSFDDPLAITVDGHQTFTLKDDEVAIIHHFDKPHPTTREQLEEEREIEDDECVDHDFKWIYALLKWKHTGDIGEWVDEVQDFPAPSWNRADPSDPLLNRLRTWLDRLLGRDPRPPVVTVSVSTCFPGWI
jgi:hypothetical protein